MSVKEYYYAHFGELTPEKQFHFATRIKNYYECHDFDEYFRTYKPSQNIAEIFYDNNYSRVNNYELRRPFFEKYRGLYGIEAALFRVHHLLAEYNLDLREDFLKLYPRSKLYELSDSLLRDTEALKILSTWAINTIYLIEELYPRKIDVVKELGEWATTLDVNNDNYTLLAYLYTHIILCESNFYTKKLSDSDNLALMKRLLDKCAEIITKNIDNISLDVCVEFLVCSNMLGANYRDLRKEIAEVCRQYRKNSPYLINYRRDSGPNSYFHTLNGAEHINVLYIMSGLDD